MKHAHYKEEASGYAWRGTSTLYSLILGNLSASTLESLITLTDSLLLSLITTIFILSLTGFMNLVTSYRASAEQLPFKSRGKIKINTTGKMVVRAGSGLELGLARESLARSVFGLPLLYNKFTCQY